MKTRHLLWWGLVLGFAILLVLALIFWPKDKPVETLERNGQSYLLFSARAEELGYKVDPSQENLEDLVEYTFRLTATDHSVSTFSFGVRGDEILGAMCDGSLADQQDFRWENDFVFFGGNIYVNASLFASLS